MEVLIQKLGYALAFGFWMLVLALVLIAIGLLIAAMAGKR